MNIGFIIINGITRLTEKKKHKHMFGSEFLKTLRVECIFKREKKNSEQIKCQMVIKLLLNQIPVTMHERYSA